MITTNADRSSDQSIRRGLIGRRATVLMVMVMESNRLLLLLLNSTSSLTYLGVTFQ